MEPIFGMPGTVEVRQGDTVVKVDTTDTVLLLLLLWLVPFILVICYLWGRKLRNWLDIIKRRIGRP